MTRVLRVSSQNAEILYTGQKSDVNNNYEVNDDPCPQCLQSGTLNILQLIDDDGGGVLDTLQIMLQS